MMLLVVGWGSGYGRVMIVNAVVVLKKGGDDIERGRVLEACLHVNPI